MNQSDEHRSQLEPHVKVPLMVLAGGGCGIVLSLGLCGAAAALPNSSSPVTAGVGISGLVVLGLSLIAIVVGVLWLLAAVFRNAFRK